MASAKEITASYREGSLDPEGLAGFGLGETMGSNGTPADLQRLQEDLRRECVFYEIYPDLTWNPGDTTLSWFEIALHAEADGYAPPDTPGSRNVFCLLTEVAKVLTQKTQYQAPYEVDFSAEYWTLHPPDDGNNPHTRLTRSLSLVFFNVAPYRRADEPALLREIQTQLSLLGVSKVSHLTDKGEQ